MRRLVAFALRVVGPILYLARRREERGERVHVYYDDGSMVPLEQGDPEADRLLALARSAI